MDNFEWNPFYSVGIDHFDNQHKELFKIGADVKNSIMNSTSADELDSILERLFQYVETHFRDEEYYMKKYNYENFDCHKKEHEKFARTIDQFYQDIKAGKFFTAIKLMNFIIDWFQDHIIKEDMNYRSLLKDKEIRSVSEKDTADESLK